MHQPRTQAKRRQALTRGTMEREMCTSKVCQWKIKDPLGSPNPIARDRQRQASLPHKFQCLLVTYWDHGCADV